MPVSVSYFFSATKLRGIAKAPLAAAAAGSGGKKGCPSCTGKGAVNCATCRGTGIDRVNGNVFERWTCTKCKGFGYLPCPVCSPSSKGLTPEQRQVNQYYGGLILYYFT
eukprot:gene25072-32695_t